MFYQIRGELLLTTATGAVIDCGGVGYQLSVSGQTLGRLADKQGSTVTLYTHLSVREDAIELFGFHSQQELGAFRMLISVSGVGPRAAMAILTQLSPDRFALAVTTNDTKALARAPGVGPKTAARIVLELKDKIAKEIRSEGGSIQLEDMPAAPKAAGSDRSETAVGALMVLGYSRPEAESALAGIDLTQSVDDIIRIALQKLL